MLNNTATPLSCSAPAGGTGLEGCGARNMNGFPVGKRGDSKKHLDSKVLQK
jgi:hypothetical protein